MEFATYAILFKKVHNWNEAALLWTEFLSTPSLFEAFFLFSPQGPKGGIKDYWKDFTGRASSEATLAGIAQTAGDLMAAIAMQVIPVLIQTEYNPDEASCLRRFFHNLISEPYNLSIGLATWVIFHIGLCCPVLALAIVAQVFMGTTYVFWREIKCKGYGFVTIPHRGH